MFYGMSKDKIQVRLSILVCLILFKEKMQTITQYRVISNPVSCYFFHIFLVAKLMFDLSVYSVAVISTWYLANVQTDFLLLQFFCFFACNICVYLLSIYKCSL